MNGFWSACTLVATGGTAGIGVACALISSTPPVGCSYDVPEPPPPHVMIDTTTVEVTYFWGGTTPMPLDFAPGNDCASGGQWYYSEQDPVALMPTRLELCTDACTTVQSDPAASIEIRFACLH